MGLSSALVAVACATACSSAAARTATFAPGVSVATGRYPVGVGIGDLDGDGRGELVVSDTTDGTVSVLSKDRTGAGFTARSPALAVGGTPFGPPVVADLNGDGRPDIAVANSRNKTVSVLLANATGTGFDALSPAPATSGTPLAVAVGDLNGDGRPDLTTVSIDGSVSVLLKDADDPGYSALSPVLSFSGGSNATVAVADLNGDGRQDIVAAGTNRDEVSVLLHDATGSGFTALSPAPDPGREIHVVAVDDLDGDGRPDLAFATATDDAVGVLLKDAADPGYTKLTPAPKTGDGPVGLAVADFNGDGRPDLATADVLAKTVTVLLKDGSGPGYTALPALPASGGMRTLTAGDLDGDGLPDLAVDDDDGNAVDVFMNTTDVDAPVSTDDVPATPVPGPVTVHLSAADPGAHPTGVASITYTVGVDPTDPTAAGSDARPYDPADPPVLQDGQRIRYFATDQAGNAETPHVSAGVGLPPAGALDTAPAGAPAPAAGASGPAAPVVAPVLAPTLGLTLRGSAQGKLTQLLLNKRSLSLHLGCGPVACQVTIRGAVTINGRRAGTLRGETLSVPAGRTAVGRLASSARLRALARRAVRTRHAAVRVTVTAGYATPAQPTQTRTLQIAVRRLVHHSGGSTV